MVDKIKNIVIFSSTSRKLLLIYQKHPVNSNGTPSPKLFYEKDVSVRNQVVL